MPRSSKSGKDDKTKRKRKTKKSSPASAKASKKQSKGKRTAEKAAATTTGKKSEKKAAAEPQKSAEPTSAAEAQAEQDFRIETDSMGEVRVPADAYYGAQTVRAIENFPVSGRRAHPAMVRAYVAIKKACAMANESLGKLDSRRAGVICQACDEILGRGDLVDQWVIDIFQAGAGTSFNMNTNEVLTNRGLELMGKARGRYDILSPNDHVNMSQSTNDTFPTAMHMAVLLVWSELREVLGELARVFNTKGRLFDNTIKSGRTHLQDAVPIRLGQEFTAYGGALDEARDRLDAAAEGLHEVALGGSAVGTGLNTHERFASTAVGNLGRIIDLPVRAASDLRRRMQSMLPVAGMSAAMRNLALELTRIANDLRLLSSGPQTGLGEIRLPPAQPGSSIMPGKVNPSLVECLNMICFQVIGNDMAVAMAVQAGQLELNVMMPGMAAALLDSMEYLKNFLPVFSQRCVEGIMVNDDACQNFFECSVGMATILNQRIGYLKAAEIAKEAVESGTSALEIIRRRKLIPEKELEEMLELKAISEPTSTAQPRPTNKR